MENRKVYTALSVILLITASLLYIIYPDYLPEGSYTQSDSEITHHSNSPENLALDVYDPLDLDNLSGKNDYEIQIWYSRLELLSHSYEDMPHAKEQVDSVMQAAKKRFPHIPL